MTNEERLQRQEKCAHFANSLQKLHRIDKTSKIAFFFTCFFAFANIFNAIITTVANGVAGGLLQVFVSLFLVVMAFWAWTKSFIPKYIMLISYFICLVFAPFFMGALDALFSLIGFVLTNITISDLREYKRLEKLYGFPHFNERLALHESEYDPMYNTVSRVNDGYMDVVGSNKTNNELLMTPPKNKSHEVFIDTLPQVEDMYSPENLISEREITVLATKLIHTLESVKKQAEVNSFNPAQISRGNAVQKNNTQGFATTLNSNTTISTKPPIITLPEPSENPMLAMLSKSSLQLSDKEKDSAESIRTSYSDYFSQYETIYDDKNKTI